MSYCWGCQPYFLKILTAKGACITLAFNSKEAAIANGHALVRGFLGYDRLYIIVVDRASEVIYRVTDVDGNIIDKEC